MEERLIGPQKNKERKMSKDVYKMSDSTIAQIVQLIQIGILTGTDISDQMRTLRIVIDEEGKKLAPCPDYMEDFQENLKRMQEVGTNTEQ